MSPGRIPAVLRTRLGDDATFGLIELLGTEQKDWSDAVLTIAADRYERRLTQEVALLRQDFSAALHQGLAAVRNELATSRVEIVRWLFLFWIGQVATTAALLALMLRVWR
jgi:hypothetical protein